ncbi:PAS domain S-box protein [Methylobacterium terricola]|uniref:Blue-light-activated histidine kinase n=1 Tax=Methylobacterium terricola TaxID=2583531 RepID=A0A5C4L978_9HYPH|nr:HWE histidine kinase domain-containing protein [Methylobacterium terricola]TNC09080.1 PAS domain S-box protein [Methylobacterium terricola]
MTGPPLKSLTREELEAEVLRLREAMYGVDAEAQRVQQQSDVAFLQSVLSSSADCIKVLDLDARLTFMTDGGMRVMEISDFNDVKGCPWPDFWTDQGNRDALAALDAARSGGLGHFQGMAHTYRGTPKWWDVQVTAIRGPDGLPQRLLAVSRDITAQKAAESHLAASEARLSTVMETVPVGILLAEAPSGRILMGNRRLAEILGHSTLYASSSNAYGEFVAYHADGRPVDAQDYPLAQITSGLCKKAAIEVLYQRPDGERRWIAISGEAIEDEQGETVGAVVAVSDIGDRKAAEAQQDILNRELSHRLKNTLTLVQSIASQTLRNAPSLDAARDALAARLVVLGKAHDILLAGQTDSASVDQVVREALSLHDDNGRRFRVSGPSLFIGPSAALSLGLMLHELATNAVKYGALSVPNGCVNVGWAIDGTGAAAEFWLDWREQGGPPVTPPTRKGFGSRLIQRGLAGGEVALRYAAEGVECTFSAPLAGLRVDV